MVMFYQTRALILLRQASSNHRYEALGVKGRSPAVSRAGSALQGFDNSN